MLGQLLRHYHLKLSLCVSVHFLVYTCGFTALMLSYGLNQTVTVTRHRQCLVMFLSLGPPSAAHSGLSMNAGWLGVWELRALCHVTGEGGMCEWRHLLSCTMVFRGGIRFKSFRILL